MAPQNWTSPSVRFERLPGRRPDYPDSCKTPWPFAVAFAYRLQRGRKKEAEQGVFVRIARYRPFENLTPDALRAYAWTTCGDVGRDRIRAAAKEKAIPAEELEDVLGSAGPGIGEETETQKAMVRERDK